MNHKPFHPQYLTGNSHYFLPYNSFGMSSENFVLDQLMIP